MKKVVCIILCLLLAGCTKIKTQQETTKTPSSNIQVDVNLEEIFSNRDLEGTYEELMAREDLGEDYLRLYVTDRYAGLELVSDLRERIPHLLEVYGMGLTETQSLSALTVDALQTLSEEDIMEKFMAENFGCSPTPEQQELFRQVLSWSREEGDLG